MRRPFKGRGMRISAESQRLITHAEGLLQASSRLEERGWERQLDLLLQKALKNQHQDHIDAALDRLFKSQPDAYEILIDTVEAASESCLLEHEGGQYEALLIAAPILAWTRFAIPSGPAAGDALATLYAHLHAHVLAADARLAIAPLLYSIDQLPRNHAETHAATRRMAQAALNGAALQAPAHLPETAPFLADTRYLLAAVVVPAGAPLFRWQASANPDDRKEALAGWQAQAAPTVARLLPGCGVDLLLPDAFFLACREADKQIRPASVKAAVHYLTHTLGVQPDRLSAVVGGFSEEAESGRVDEYRISFLPHPGEEVVYGLVWPLYGDENGDNEMPVGADVLHFPGAEPSTPVRAPLQDIMQMLKEEGVVHIKHHPEIFQMEFCDDCGAPLYCDLEGELVHAEMPEESAKSAPHLH